MPQRPRALRVLLVHERFPPDFAGGGEYVVLETARHLLARGHAVTVVTAGDPLIEEFQGIPTRRLPISRYRMNLAWKSVERAACDVDLIHTFTYHATYPAYRAGRALGKPVICGVLALFGRTWREMRGTRVGALFQGMEKFLLRLPLDARVYLSEASHATARELNLQQPSDVVIEPGISLEDYSAHDEKTYVMFAGKLDVRKGIDTVLQVAAKLPEVPFRIIGWGERYHAIDATKPPNVRLEPFVDRMQLAKVLSQARVFLFPTKAETFGLIVVEAMASGCAIVSTSPLPFEGIRLQDDGIESATNAVRALWHEPELCRRQGDANRRMAQRYNWRRHVERLELLYRQVSGLNACPNDRSAS